MQRDHDWITGSGTRPDGRWPSSKNCSRAMLRDQHSSQRRAVMVLGHGR
jgi:hypothetical protein